MIDPGLRDRVALVTGANQGIGAAVARGLASQGAAVFVHYLRLPPSRDPGLPREYDVERARSGAEVVERIEAAGGRAVCREADLREPAAVAALFDRAEQSLGPVEILVNNADAWAGDTFVPGTSQDRFGRAATPVSASTHDHHFEVNSRGTAAMIAEFARRHVDRGAVWGRIVGLTSGGRDGFPGEASYGASKAALESYSLTAAWELGRFGITSNLVHPPATDTGWITDDVRADVVARSPLGHVGTPDEVADVVVFLASEQARFVTGQRITMS